MGIVNLWERPLESGGSTLTMNTIGSWTNDGTFFAGAYDTFSLMSSAGSTGANTGAISSTGGNVTISGGTWTTATVDQISVSNGSLTLGGSWSFPAQGDITLTGTSSLNLGGSFTTAQAVLITYAPDSTEVYVSGSMDNSASLALSATTGPWYLYGGTITGGSITGIGADTLVATTTGGTLSGVSIPSGTIIDVSQAWGANLTITNNLALDGTILLGNASGSTYGDTYWSGSPSWTGGGSILSGGSTNNRISENLSNQTLTIGSSLTIHGQAMTIYLESGSTLNNQGTIDSDVSGGTFTLNGNFTLTNGGTIEATATAPGYSAILMNTIGSWTNSGTMFAASGDTLSLIATSASTGTNTGTGTIKSTGGNLTISGGTWSTTGVGDISVSDGSLTLGGAWMFATLGDIATSGSTVLNLGGTYSIAQASLISYPSGSTVNVTGALDITGGLTLTSATGPWYLDGGTISGGTITGSGANTLIATTTGGKLSNVTIAATTTLDLSQYWGATVTITNGLTNDGLILLGNAAGSTYGSLYWTGGQTWTGTGSIQVGASTNNRIGENDSGQTFIFATTVHGQSMTINLASNSTFDNQGTINCDTASGNFLFNGNFILANSGTIEATATGAGSSITMNTIGNWTNTGSLLAGTGDSLILYQIAGTTGANTGTIAGTGGSITIGSNGSNVGSWSTVGVGNLSVSNGSLTLGGAWTCPVFGDIATTGTSSLYLGGTFPNAQAMLVSYPAASTTVYLSGIMNNALATLTLSASTGPWYLLGGTVTGGTISDISPDTLVATTSNGTLSGVTVSGGSIIDVTQAWGATITITNGLTNNGTILLGNPSGTTYGDLEWTGGPQSWGGNGDILAGASTNNRINENDSNQTLTFASPLLVHGKSLVCYLASNSTLANQATIDCDVAGGAFNLYGGFSINNTGTIENTAGGGSMTFTASSFTNAGTIAIGQTSAQAWTCTGNFTQTAAGTLDVLIGGTTSGLYDTLAVSGAASLAGHVAITTYGGYYAHSPDAVILVTAGSMTGSPSSSNASFAVTTTATTLVASATDSLTPTVVVTTPVSPTSLNPIPFTLTFSEPVSTPVSGGFTVTNASSTVVVTGGPVIFTAMVTPTSPGAVSLTVNAGAVTNSGSVGNAVSSTATVTYNVAPMLTITPVSGSIVSSEPINFVVTASTPVSTLSSGGLSVSGGMIGTITGGSTSYTVPVTVTSPGTVQFQVIAGAVTAISGGGANLATPVIQVTYAPGGNTVWTGGGADSLWTTSGNWSNGVPVLGSGVVIPPGANVTLTVATASLSSLNLQGSLTINSTGTLLLGQSPNTLTLNGGTLTMNGGTLASAVIGNGTGGTFLATNTASTLNGVTIGAGVTFDMSQTNNAECSTTNGLTVNGTVLVGAPGVSGHYATLTWNGTQSWAGTGNIVLGGSSNNEIVDVSSGYQLTIQNTLAIHGTGGNIYGYYGGTILNYGAITADANGSLRLYALDWTNEAGGTLSAASGATLTIYTENAGTGSNAGTITGTDGTVTFTGTGTAQWSNSGTITGTNTVFNMGTSTSTTTLLSFPGQQSGGNTINITGGTVTGSGVTTITPAHGPWYLAGGTISNCTISGIGSMLIATSTNSTLNAVIIDTQTVFDMSQNNNSQCSITNGLTVNGSVLVGAPGASGNYATLTWNGTQSWGGAGNIVLGGSSDNEIVDVSSAYQLTILNMLTIHGTGGNIYGYYSGTILNHGTITADAYGSLRIYALDWTNEADGVLSAATGATLTIYTESGGTGSNLGHITSTDSTIDITGAGTWTNGGTISSTNTIYNIGSPTTTATLITLPGQSTGNSINITSGTISNPGTITITAANGPWYLNGGTINGGTISGTGAMLIATTAGGTLNNVIIDTQTILDLSQVSNANCTITGGLTVNGAVLVGSANGSTYGRITWTGSQSWGGGGNIVFGSSSSNQIIDSTAAALTIDSSLHIHGLGGILYAYYSSTLNNYGSIAVDAGGALSINAYTWVNESSPQGVISAASDSTLTITSGASGANLGQITSNDSTITWNGAGTFVSTGSIVGTNSIYNVGVNTTSSTLLTIPGQASGDTINLTAGAMTNAGTSTLSSTNGPWHLSGATIVGGAIAGTIGASGPVLIATPQGGSLSNVTIANGATFDMSQYGNTSCTTLLGLTVNGTVLVGSTVTSNYGLINWAGSQTWAGGGEILFGESGNNRINDTLGGTTLTIGSSLTMHGQNALLRANQGGSSILNQGTIASDVAGGVFAVTAGTFTNAGILSLGLASPQTMTCSGNFVQTAAGTLDILVGGLNNCSTISVSGGSATLNGAVHLTALPGYYVHQGDAFTVTSATSLSGTFATHTGPFTMNYTATSAIAMAADTAVPTVVITTPTGITNASPIPFTLTFSEPVTAPSIATGFTVTGGSVGKITGGPVVYTASVTPAQLGTAGTISLYLNAGAVQNSGAVANAQSSTIAVTYDPVAPTVSFLPVANSYTNASPFTLTLTFSKPVTAPALTSIQVTNGSAASVATVSSSVYTVQITPTLNGTVTVQLAAGAVFDSASNGNALATDTLTFDNVPPHVLSITPNGSTVSGPFAFQVTFTEAVQQFTAANFTLTGATLGTISGSGASWSVPVTPTASPVTLSVTSALDLAGNALVIDGNASASVTYSVGALTVVSITPNGGYTNVPISFQIVFSAAIGNLTSGNLTLTAGGGTIGTITGSGTTWTVPVSSPGQGLVSLTVNSVIGASLASPASASITYDTIAPTILTVAPPNGGTSNNQNLSFVVTFSEPVNPPDFSSFQLTGGNAGAFSGSGAVWTIPVSSPSQGLVSLQILSASDLAGNPLVGTPTYTITYNTTPPTILSILPANGTLTNSPITFVVTFSEPVNAPLGGNISITGGALGAVVANGATWSIPVQNPSQGAVTLTINSASDLAGNPLATPSSSSVIYDTVPPTVLSISPNGGYSNSASPAFTVTFSESVTALLAGNIVMTGGTPGTITGSGAIWTIPITAPSQGAVTISVNGVGDLADNTQTVAGTASFTYDTINPTATITPNGGVTGGPFSFVVTFSEAVVSPTSQNVAVTGGNAGTLVVNGLTWTIPVVPTLLGPVTLNLSGVTDLAGNPLFGTGVASASITYSTTGPTVTSITPNGGYSNSSNLTFTVTFSEPVNAPIAANLQLTGGTLGTISGSGATWTIPVSEPVEGTITLDVLSATDLASNPLNLTASDIASVTYDITPPSIVSITPNSGVVGSSPITFLVTFSEPVSPPTAENLMASVGTVGTVVVNGSTWTVPVSNLVEGPVSLTVSGVTDLATNPLVAPMTATVTYDIPPTIVSITPNGGTTSSSPIPFVVTTSKALSGLAAGATNGAVQQGTGGGTSWTIPVLPTSDGLVTLTIPIGGAVDLVGSSNVAAASASVTFGSAAPTVIVTTTAAETNVSPIIFTATFSAPVSALAPSGVTVTNGLLGAITGGPVAYTIPINPTSNGTVTVQIQAAAVTDASNTPNLASAVASEIYDTIPPTATLSISSPLPLTLASTTLTVAFSEAVSGFSSEGLNVTNATVSGFTALNATTYTATLAPNASASILVSVPAGVCADLAGNANLASDLILPIQTTVLSTQVATPAIAVSSQDSTVYQSLCPGTWSGLGQIQAFLAGKANNQAVGYVWDAVQQTYDQVPAQQPVGGWQPYQGVFLATRLATSFNFNGYMSSVDYELVLKPGWNFVGIPPLDDNGTETITHQWSQLWLEDMYGNAISGAERVNLIDVGAWFWNGTYYSQIGGALQSGLGYWIENDSSPGVDLVLRRLSAAEIADPTLIVNAHHGTAAAAPIGYHAHGSPPPPPDQGASAQSSSSQGCGLGSGIGAMVGSFALLILRLVSQRRQRVQQDGVMPLE